MGGENMEQKNIFRAMEDDIHAASELSDAQKQALLNNVFKLKNHKVNLMITGATGCGKSSTINAMFKTEVAKVGVGVDPETMDIQKYELGNLVLWDSPGLGDGKEKDIEHSKGIIKKLNELDDNGKPLIDMVLVILDGGSRDLGTSYELINQVIIPNLGQATSDRILIAINQADVAMKGRYWNFKNNKPEPELIAFLGDKVASVKGRVMEATGVNIEPIYYSAGYKDGDEEQTPWNLSKLLYFIVKNTPTEKRLSYVDNISDKKEMWQDDDGLKEYRNEVRSSFAETVQECASACADFSGELLEVFGKTAGKIGRLIGGAVGAITGAIKGFFGLFG